MDAFGRAGVCRVLVLILFLFFELAGFLDAFLDLFSFAVFEVGVAVIAHLPEIRRNCSAGTTAYALPALV